MAELQQQIIFKESVSESQQSEAIIDSFFNSARQLWFPRVYFGKARLLAPFKRQATRPREKIREENSGDCLMVISITERKGKLATKKSSGRGNGGKKATIVVTFALACSEFFRHLSRADARRDIRTRVQVCEIICFSVADRFPNDRPTLLSRASKALF